MQTFNKAQAKENFEQTAENMSSSDVQNAADSGKSKMDNLSGDVPKALLDYWQDLKEMVSLLKDYFTGDYTEAPWKVISAVAAAVLYFVSPIDLVPDVIPILGFLDDAFIISMCLSLCRSDLDDYRRFKSVQTVSDDEEESQQEYENG